MKVNRQSFRHRQGNAARQYEGRSRRSTNEHHSTAPQAEFHDGGREMNTLHGNSTGAVVTRLHDVVRTAEKSGAVSGRGCARGTGRQHTTYMSVVDAHVGEAARG